MLVASVARHAVPVRAGAGAKPGGGRGRGREGALGACSVKLTDFRHDWREQRSVERRRALLSSSVIG